MNAKCLAKQAIELIKQHDEPMWIRLNHNRTISILDNKKYIKMERARRKGIVGAYSVNVVAEQLEDDIEFVSNLLSEDA